MNTILKINPELETKRIIEFLKKTFAKQKIENAVIGLSGGIDSAVSLYLVKKVLEPENIFVAHLPYFPNTFPLFQKITKDTKTPKENTFEFSIKESVDACTQSLDNRHSGKQSASRIDSGQVVDTRTGIRMTELDQTRLGNIMARIRMIFLFDLAKKHNAMVVGTENKSEHCLGYFTRFGDAASDIEPIQHLYKSQIFELAKYLGVPEEIINQKPSANLWKGQTDEGEFGFTYEEADQVLYYYLEQKLSVEEIKKKEFPNAGKIIQRAKTNEYKHHTPYSIK